LNTGESPTNLLLSNLLVVEDEDEDEEDAKSETQLAAARILCSSFFTNSFPGDRYILTAKSASLSL